jgi:hypothetical protein
MRYEVPVRVEFFFGSASQTPDDEIPPLPIESGDRRFVWHAARDAPNGLGRCAPVATVMQPDDNADAAGLAVNRFLSTLSYGVDFAIGIGWSIATSYKRELDPPAACDVAVVSRVRLSPVRRVDVEESSDSSTARGESVGVAMPGVYEAAGSGNERFESAVAVRNSLA